MESYVSNIFSKIAGVFSGFGIAAINIIVSGYLWGVILSLDKKGDNYFQIALPAVIKIKITSEQVIAGFAAFTLSLVLVGLWLHNLALSIFITNLQLTNKKQVACQLLATSISVFICIIVLLIKFVIGYFEIMRLNKGPIMSDSQIVRALVAASKEEDQ